MKIEELLFEDYKKVDNDWIKTNCSEAIEQYKKGFCIYRGDKEPFVPKNESVLMTPETTQREAAHASSNLHTDIVNNTKRFKQFPDREIVMTTNQERASAYGFLFLALPINGAKIGILPEDDIFVSFKRIPSQLEHFYDVLGTDFLKHIQEVTTSDFWNMTSTNKVFKDIKNNSTDDFIEDLIRKISKSDSLEYYKVKDILINCINDGNGEELFKLFTPEGWGVKNIKQFNTVEDREVWTDSSVVLIRMKSDEEEDY